MAGCAQLLLCGRGIDTIRPFLTLAVNKYVQVFFLYAIPDKPKLPAKHSVQKEVPAPKTYALAALTDKAMASVPMYGMR